MIGKCNNDFLFLKNVSLFLKTLMLHPLNVIVNTVILLMLKKSFMVVPEKFIAITVINVTLYVLAECCDSLKRPAFTFKKNGYADVNLVLLNLITVNVERFCR